MSTSWKVAIVFLPTLFALAAGAYAWTPPGKVLFDMRRELVNQNALDIRIQGTMQGAPIRGDLVVRDSAPTLARLSYPPFPLINNQWITFSSPQAQHMQSPVQEFGEMVRLTKRIRLANAEGRNFRRYEFVVTAGALPGTLPALFNGTGEIWFPSRGKLPSRMVMRFPSGASVEEILLTFAYEDRFNGGVPHYARSITDVREQLRQMQTTPRKTPSLLIPLAEQGSEFNVGAYDFDQDQLHDVVELFYGTDPANPDTDNDTVLDGVEVSAGNDPRAKLTQ